VTKTSESLTVEEAAEFAKVGVRRVYAALKSGALSGTQLGGSAGWRTTRTDVNKWARDGFPSGEEDSDDGPKAA